MAPGARSKFDTLMFDPEVFRNHVQCIEEITCDIVGTFWRPAVIRRPGIVPPFLTPYAPGDDIPK